MLSTASLIFWDFDGVIKESVDIKTAAYEFLFLPYGSEIARNVREHHEANGGMSRFDKIPMYLRWAGEQPTAERVESFCEQFSQAVLQAVIDAPWVPGVREYILRHFSKQYLVLVTATPQDEIEQILSSLELFHCFREVYGAPTKKAHAIKAVLDRQKYEPAKALVVGDAETDLQAAQANLVPFVLRRTPFNLSLQASWSGPVFENLNYE